MDLQKAIALKSTLSYSFLKLQRKNLKTISFSPGVPAAKITNIHKSMQAIVNGVGIGEMPNGESYIKVLTKAKSQSPSFSRNISGPFQDYCGHTRLLCER